MADAVYDYELSTEDGGDTYQLGESIKILTIKRGYPITVDDVYEDGNTLYDCNIQNGYFIYTPSTSGQHVITTFSLDEGIGYQLTIIVTEPVAESITWAINNKTIQSLTIGNKEIQTIERVSDGAIIYQRKINTHFTLVNQNQRMIVLVDENDNPIPNKTIRVCYNDGTSCSDYTTNANNPVVADGIIYSATFNGDSEYNGCEYSQITPVVLSISATKDVLSAYHGDTCTLTATVLDNNNNPCSGETVVFKRGLTTLDTKTTDSNGQCTYTYNSQGSGDVTLKAVCGSLQQTYAIEDCDYTIIPDTVVSTSSGDKNFLQYTVESDFILTADYYPTDTWEWFMVKDVNMSIVGVFSSSYDKSSYFGITNLGYNGWKNITIKLENGILTFIYGSTTVTKDVSSYTTPFLWNFIINRANTRFKNFKLKKLNYVNGITLSTNKEVISKYHSESATITAHIDDGAGQTVAMKVYDSTQTTLLDTLSVTDIGGGDYTATYTAKGYGNVKIVAEYDSLQKSKTIEDCIYALLPQIDTPRNGTTYHLLNGDVISELPSTYSVEYEMKTSTAPTSGNEQRIYWVPTTLWTGSAQPSEAMFTGYCYSLKYELGRRYNGSTTSTTYTGSAVNRWDKIKINKVDNNSRFDVYLNGTYKNNWTLNNAKNYSTWEFGFALWSNTTYSIQNIKIKPL